LLANDGLVVVVDHGIAKHQGNRLSKLEARLTASNEQHPTTLGNPALTLMAPLLTWVATVSRSIGVEMVT
jgi:hypothetical protein